MTLFDKILEIMKKYFNKLLLVFAIVAMVYIYIQPHSNTSFINESCKNISNDWTYTNKKNEQCTVTFPTVVDDYIGDRFIATRTLPEIRDGEYLFLSCIYTDFRIYINNDIIYGSSANDSGQGVFKRGMGSYWAAVRLPRDCSGKIITLEVSSPYEMYEEMQSSVYIGTKMSVMCSLLKRFGYEYFIGIFCILLSMIMLIISISNQIHKVSSHSKFAVADVLFWSGLWIMSENTLIQFYSSNSAFNIILSYFSVQMMLRGFFIYLNKLMPGNRRRQKVENFMTVCLCAYIVTALFLHVTGVFTYFYSSFIFEILMGIYISYMLCKMFYFTVIKKKNVPYIVVIVLCMICVCAIVEILIYNLLVELPLGVTLIPCLGILACTFGIYEIRSTRVHINMGYQAKHFEKLASYDSMTGCRNRTSYIEYMNNEGHKIKELENTVVFVCDINNMKEINDVHGHANGDTAIMTCALILKECFNEYGDIFRIGGDEFVGIFPNAEAAKIELTVADVYKKTKLYADEFDFPFTVSIGVANVNLRIDNSLSDTFDRADKKMYTMKKAMKR